MTRGDDPYRVPQSKTTPTEDDLRMSANVARLRKERGLSQAKLAERMREAGQAHWRQTTVSRVERGQQKLGMEDLEALSEILGGVMAGTELAARASSAARSLVRNMTVHKLRAADEALSDALLHVRGLRVLHERGFDESAVRAAYEEDVRRGVDQAEE